KFDISKLIANKSLLFGTALDEPNERDPKTVDLITNILANLDFSGPKAKFKSKDPIDELPTKHLYIPVGSRITKEHSQGARIGETNSLRGLTNIFEPLSPPVDKKESQVPKNTSQS